MLSLEHVAKTHWVGPYQKQTLVDVSLTLGVGEFVGVWGTHRSGKSTLLRVAAGLESPDRGVVRVGDRDLAQLTRAQLGRLRLGEVGLVRGQRPHSAEWTVADYVTLPLLRSHSHAEARRRAMAALRRVDIVECHSATWTQLSDTERALVSLAHGLVRQPRLLLVDDLTQGLDAPERAEMVELLDAVASTGVAVLMTASSMHALVGTHAAFLLSDGTLAPVTDPPTADNVIDFPGEHTG